MITSIHEYELAADTTASGFEKAIQDAESRGLFELPGLIGYEFLRGVKGERTDQYTAIWRYESQTAWRELWGPIDDPLPKSEYPDKWNVWEDKLLAPLLAEDPDEISFTSYEVVKNETT